MNSIRLFDLLVEINDINCLLDYGNFEYHMDSGDIRFKTCYEPNEGLICCEDLDKFPETLRDIKSGAAKSLNNTDYVLIEMSPFMTAWEIFECADNVFEQTGKKIVLAHIERYSVLNGEDEVLKHLKELGCMFQINSYSLMKEKNERIRTFARKLLSEGLVDFIGSDAHRIDHRPPELLNGIEYIYENCDKDYADAVCFGNVEKLILNNN